MRDYAAAVLACDDRAEPLNCLVREISQGGVQIRINAAQSIPDPGYLINLKCRSAYHTHVVWRRGSLVGLSYDEEYRIIANLPAHLNFLGRLLVDAQFGLAGQLIAQGMETEAALRKLGIAQDAQ